VSAESGVQRVVSEVVKKDLDLGAIERVARGARERRLPLLVHFMIGLPGETRAEMNQTLELAARLSERFGAEASLQYATPLPGTALARSLVHLPVVEDWGPHFQQRPSPTSTEASPEDLVRFKRAFADRLALGRRPRRVLLQTTFECNNRCAFCTTGTREQRPGDLARHLALLAEARQNGARELWLDGGEPTLFPALFTLIREARALGFETVGLVTNGRRAAYPEYAARLARSGLSHLAFTLQGASAARHAREVGVAEAFEQTIAAVRNVRRAAEPRLRLSVKTTMTRTNLDELSAIASLVHELGVPRLDLEMTLPCGARTGELAPDPSLAADAAGRVIAAWRDRLEVNVSNLPWCFLPGFEDHLLPDELMSPSPVTLLGNDAPVLDYWRSHREHRAQCTTCVRRVCCGGFFLESGVEEPDWLGGARVSS
jgi:organic radical activating enzyme